MLSPGRYLKPITGGDTEGTGKATVIEIMRFGEELWYRHGGDSVLYDLNKHQLDEKTLVREGSQLFGQELELTNYGTNLGTQGHQAEDDLLFPERLRLIELIKASEVEADQLETNICKGQSASFERLDAMLREMNELSESYLEVPKP